MAEDLHMLPGLEAALEAFASAHPTCQLSLRQVQGVITKVEATIVVPPVPLAAALDLEAQRFQR